LFGSGRERPDYVASPLSRARETMEIVRSALGLPPAAYQTEPRLREIHHGSWEGKFREEIHAEDPQSHAAFTLDPWSFAPPGDGAESYAMLSARVWAWFGALERDTVIVAHGGASRCIQGRLLGLAPKEIPHLTAPQDRVLRIENGAMTWC
jgi:probable phosphoglycerate mutase